MNIRAGRGPRLALGVALVCAASGCFLKPKKSASGTRDDTTPGAPSDDAPKGGRYRPEDLAVLFPVERALFATPFGSDADLEKELSAQLVPLSAFVDPALYAQVVAELVRATTETNALADPLLAPAISSFPASQWYVTGLRFVPCGTGRLGIPAAWNARATAFGPSIAELSCSPDIQLSVQRFARMTCQGCDGKPTSDDKALHLIAEFHGGLDAAKIKRLDDVRNTVNAALSDGIAKGTLDAAEAARYVGDAYRPAEVQAILGELRGAFLDRVDSLRDPAAGGPLRLSYGAKDALPRYRAFLSQRFAQVVTLRVLTHNFSLAGAEPGFGEKWVFGKIVFNPPSSPGGLPTARRARIDSLVVDDQGKARVVSAGELENLTDTQGSRTAIDRDLRNGILALPPAVVREVFTRTALGAYAYVKEDAGKATLESIASESVGTPELGAAMQQGYEASLDVSAHDITSPSCASCHVATPVRLRYGFAAIPGAVGRDDALGMGNMDLAAVGPNTKLTQVEFKQTWLLRAFGYVGQAPSIADRTVREVDVDVRKANELRGP